MKSQPSSSLWPELLLQLVTVWMVVTGVLMVVAIGSVVAALWWVVQAPGRLSAWAARRAV